MIRHVRERTKPSNTTRILERLVANCTVFDHAEKDAPLTESAWRDPGRRHLVLFPSENAIVLDAVQWREVLRERAVIVLLDATWRQARRMSRRAPGVSDLPHYRLPEGGPSRWRVRTAPRSDQLCTLETVLRLLEMESASSAEVAALEDAFAHLEVPSHREEGSTVPPPPES